eukprot:scaffold71713_cov33-Phaeocystis_antarctica.AAC.1
MHFRVGDRGLKLDELRPAGLDVGATILLHELDEPGRQLLVHLRIDVEQLRVVETPHNLGEHAVLAEGVTGHLEAADHASRGAAAPRPSLHIVPAIRGPHKRPIACSKVLGAISPACIAQFDAAGHYGSAGERIQVLTGLLTGIAQAADQTEGVVGLARECVLMPPREPSEPQRRARALEGSRSEKNGGLGN